MFAIVGATLLWALTTLAANAAATVNGTLYTVSGEDLDLAGCPAYLYPENSGSSVDSTFTDSNGEFTLSASTAGAYRLTVENSNATGDCDGFTGGGDATRYLEDNETTDLSIFAGDLPGEGAVVRVAGARRTGLRVARLAVRPRDDRRPRIGRRSHHVRRAL